MMSTSHTFIPFVERAILQFLDGTQIMNPRFEYMVYEGIGFSVSQRFEGVADDASVDVYFENPVGSGKKVYIIEIEVISLGQAYIDIYRGNTVTASGTAITPVNLNFEKATVSVCNVEHSGTYATGTLTLSAVCPGGSKKQACGGQASVGEVVVMPEGFNFLIRVTNKSGGNTDMSIRLLWWEESL